MLCVRVECAVCGVCRVRCNGGFLPQGRHRKYRERCQSQDQSCCQSCHLHYAGRTARIQCDILLPPLIEPLLPEGGASGCQARSSKKEHHGRLLQMAARESCSGGRSACRSLEIYRIVSEHLIWLESDQVCIPHKYYNMRKPFCKVSSGTRFIAWAVQRQG